MRVPRRPYILLLLFLGFPLGHCGEASSPFGPTDTTENDAGTSLPPTPPTDTVDPGRLTETDTELPPTPIVLATWNLHNFSKWGANEFRLDDIAAKIRELNADVLGVQELKIADPAAADGVQAWDVLLEELDGFEGIHVPWNSYDTVVGLIVRKESTQILSSQVLFDDDNYAFPRAPLEATLEVKHGTKSHLFSVIVVHLKAFKDDVDRRRAACEKLRTYIQEQETPTYVILGDFNDDPYDAPPQNAFLETLLEEEPDFYFVTATLPLGSVTSTGYGTSVNGTWKTGEFLDHIVLSGPLYESWSNVSAAIQNVPVSAFDTWENTYSDHFPVVVTLTP